MANVYNTLIQNSYASTISGQIDKIEDARDVIKSKAIELGLKIPARQKLTSNAQGATDLTLIESHSLLDTAAAIDTIVVNTPPSETASSLGAGGSYTVPVGYNKVAYTITASGLSDQTGGDANPLDILWGKTAWVNGAQVTGAMLDKTGDQGASGISSYQHTDGKHYLALTIPETGKYEGGKSLQSNIAYNYADELLILPITIYHTDKEELAIDTSQATFQAGYYSGAFNVQAVLKDGGNKVLNVSNNVPTLEGQSGNLIIPDGFDYFAPNASYTIKEGSIADIQLSGDKDTGQVKMYGGEVTAGWISSINTSAIYTPPTAEFGTSDVSGKIKVTAAGWISKDTEIGGIQQVSSLEVSDVQRNGSTATQTVPANSYYVSATVTQGYVATTTTKDLDLGVSKFYLTLDTTSMKEINEITASTFYGVSTEGYTEGQITEYKVKKGTIGTPSVDNNYILKVPVQEGWVSTSVITYEGQDQQYAMSEADMRVSDHTFTVEAQPNTLMKSLEINTRIIYDKLSSI